MPQDMNPGVAKIERKLVDPAGATTALAHALLTAIVAQMARDGDTTVRASSAKRLTHARATYESAWFQDTPQPAELSEFLGDFVYFVEQTLWRAIGWALTQVRRVKPCSLAAK